MTVNSPYSSHILSFPLPNLMSRIRLGLFRINLENAAIYAIFCHQNLPIFYIFIKFARKSIKYTGITCYASYNKCDRIADYRRAWTFLENKYNKK